jgi:hypothetical protein
MHLNTTLNSRSLPLYIFSRLLSLVHASLRALHERNLAIQLIELLPDPTNSLTRSPHNAQSTRKPQPRDRHRDAVDHIPPPLLLQIPMLRVRTDLTRLPAHPLRDTPGEVPHARGHQRAESSERDEWMRREAVRDVRQTDQAVIAVHIHGKNARGPHVEARKREQHVAQQTCAAERRPGDGPLVCERLGAVALQGLAPSVEPQCNARGYVCEERERNDERLGERGLVVWPCQEEVAVCLGHGADGEGDQRGVGDVEGGEDAEGVRRVLLDPCYWCC